MRISKIKFLGNGLSHIGSSKSSSSIGLKSSTFNISNLQVIDLRFYSDGSFVKESRTCVSVSDYKFEELTTLCNASFKACYNLSQGGVNFNYNNISSGFLSTFCILLLSSSGMVNHIASTNSLHNETTICSFHGKLMLNIGYLARTNGDKFLYNYNDSTNNFEGYKKLLNELYDTFESSDFS
jgi:hypothetical protein